MIIQVGPHLHTRYQKPQNKQRVKRSTTKQARSNGMMGLGYEAGGGGGVGLGWEGADISSISGLGTKTRPGTMHKNG